MNVNFISVLFISTFLLLDQFAIVGGLTVGVLFLVLLLSLIFAYERNEFKIKANAYFLFFILVVYFSTFFSGLRNDDFVHGTAIYYVRGLLLVIGVLVVSPRINLNTHLNVLNFFGYLFSIVVICQALIILITKNPLSPINILPFPVEQQRLWSESYRVSGLFTEPQLFATVIIPIIIANVVTRSWKSVTYFSLSVLFCGSTYGFAILLFLFIWYLLYEKIYLKKQMIYLAFILFIMSFALLSSGALDEAINKIISTNLIADIRVGKGVLIFYEMTAIEKLFGLDISVSDYVRENISYFPTLLPYLMEESHLLNYISGFWGIVVHYGIISLLPFIAFLISVYLKGCVYKKAMVVFIILHSLSATIMFNGYFVYLFILLLSPPVIYEINENIK